MRFSTFTRVGGLATMVVDITRTGNTGMVFAQIVLPLEQTVALAADSGSISLSQESLVLCSIALCLLGWCLISPTARGTIVGVFAVIAVGSGTGILTWGICSAVRNEEVRSLAILPALVATPSDAIGLGTGLLVAGIMTLALAHTMPRRSRAKEPPVAAAIGLCRDAPQTSLKRRSVSPPAAATIGLRRHHG